MKRIIVISSVKNECDIIESFCRYNLTFCDCMLIHENYKSSDNTRDILQRLIDEGLPISFEAEEDMYFEKAKRMLAEIAVHKYGADLVVPLDADEFLCHIDGANPREALESFEEDVEYQIPWRTYIYERELDAATAFVPNYFTHYRNPILDEVQGHAGKTLVSKFLLTSKKAEFVHGAHWLTYPGAHKAARIEVSRELVCAHYPIRNRKQVMMRAVPSRINKWSLPESERIPSSVFDTHQLGILFNAIKEHGDISEDIMREVSLTYSLYNIAGKEKIDKLVRDLGEDVTVEGVMETAFCTDRIAMRYASLGWSEKVFLRSTLEVLDVALRSLDDESRGKTQEMLEQRCELEQLRGELERLYDELERLRDELTEIDGMFTKQIEGIYASVTWRIGYNIMRVVRFFMPWKRKK